MPDAPVAPPEQIELPPLWPRDVRIPIIGCAGELNTGKTLFGLSIDPANTIVYDLEKSSEIYMGLGFERIDVGDRMLERHPNGYGPVDVFNFICEDIRSIPAGKFSVLVIDPVTDMEIGAVDFVQNNPEKFSRTKTQYEKAQGLMWGDLKNYWKAILLDFTSRFQTFYFTAHMRQVWKGNAPTSKREPQGKDTLAKLASLYLLLDRNPDKNGAVPEKPHARVLKDRLAHTAIIDGEPIITPILPPQLSEATPKAIRAYITKPPNYAKLTTKEKLPDLRLTDDQKLEIQVEISRNEIEAEEMKASRFEKMGMAAGVLEETKKQKAAARSATRTVDQQSAAKPTEAKMDAARAQEAPPSASSPESPHKQLRSAEEARVNAEAIAEAGDPSAVNLDTLKNLFEHFEALAMSAAQIKKACQKRGANRPEDLTPDGAKELLDKMWNLNTARNLATGESKSEK